MPEGPDAPPSAPLLTFLGRWAAPEMAMTFLPGLRPCWEIFALHLHYLSYLLWKKSPLPGEAMTLRDMTSSFLPPVKTPFGQVWHRHGANSAVPPSFPNGELLLELTLLHRLDTAAADWGWPALGPSWNIPCLGLITVHCWWGWQLVVLLQALNQPDLEGVLGSKTGNLPSSTQTSGWEGPPQGQLLLTSGMRDGEFLSHFFSVVWTLLSGSQPSIWTSENPHLLISKGLFTHDAFSSLSMHGKGKCLDLQQTVGKLSQGGTELFNGAHTGPMTQERSVTGIQLIV